MSSPFSVLLAEKVRIFEIPEPLQSYIRDKGRSSYSNLWFIPWAFPVFIMNPTGYGNPRYKETLSDYQSKSSSTLVDSATVPSGEVWEILNLYGAGTVAGNMTLNVNIGAVSRIFDYAANETRIKWSGSIFIDAGYKIRLATSGAGGDVFLYTIGAKRYA